VKLLIRQKSPGDLFLPLLRSNILLSTLFSNILSLCSSLNARDQVPLPLINRQRQREGKEILSLEISSHLILLVSINNTAYIFSPAKLHHSTALTITDSFTCYRNNSKCSTRYWNQRFNTRHPKPIQFIPHPHNLFPLHYYAPRKTMVTETC
jgi:hypothetical protein